jgi:hypothetical protein
MSVIAGIAARREGVRVDREEVAAMLRAMTPLSGIPPEREPEYRASSDGGIVIGRLRSGPAAASTAPDAGGVQVLAVGELYADSDPAAIPPDEELARRYEREGSPGFTRELNGSFAAAMIDKRGPSLLLVTDHYNSRALYVGRLDDRLCFASEVKGLLALQCVGNAPDRAAVVSLLAQGSIPKGRTLAEGIRKLEYATVSRFEDGRSEEAHYWRFRYQEGPRRPAREMIAELQGLLRGAIRRRELPGRIALCLSGGVDSRGMLACVGRPADVSICTYTGEAAKRQGRQSDLSVAKRLAEMAGLSCQVFAYRSEDVLRTIAESVFVSDGAAGFVFESYVGIWDPIIRDLGARACLVADMMWGIVKGPVSPPLVGGWLGLYGLSPHSVLRGLLRSDRVDQLVAAADQEVRDLVAGTAAKDTRDQVDELYFTHRVQHFLNPKRAIVTRRGLRTRTPWLDRHILDFMMTVPAPWRFRKRLYRQAAEGLDPRLFSLPRGRSDQTVSYLAALRRMEAESKAVSRAVFDDNPLLEEFFDTTRLSRYVNSVLTLASPVKNETSWGRLKAWIRKRLIPVQLRQLLRGMRSYLQPNRPLRMSPEWYLLSIITVAVSLRMLSQRFAWRPAHEGMSRPQESDRP